MIYQADNLQQGLEIAQNKLNEIHDKLDEDSKNFVGWGDEYAEAEEEKEYLQGYINGLIDSRQFVSKKEGSK